MPSVDPTVAIVATAVYLLRDRIETALNALLDVARSLIARSNQ